MTITLPSSNEIISHITSHKQHCTRKNLLKAKLFILGGFISHRGVLGIIKGALAGVGILGLTLMHKPADMGNMNEIAVCGNNKVEQMELCDGSTFNKSLKLADPAAWMCSDTCQITLKDDTLIQELTAPVVVKKSTYAKNKTAIKTIKKVTPPPVEATETFDDLAQSLTQETNTTTTTIQGDNDSMDALIQTLAN